MPHQRDERPPDMSQKPTADQSMFARFRALPGRQRVLFGLVGMTLSGAALSLSELPDARQEGEERPPHGVATELATRVGSSRR